MENLNQGKLDTLVNIFSEMMKNKEFAALLKQRVQQEHEEKLEFTQKEINKMPTEFKKLFIHDNCRARIYKRKVSENAYTYDIKYRRDGYNVCVTDKILARAKEKFIEALKNKPQKMEKVNGIPITFNAFAMYYFENFRKRRVAENTYKGDLGRYKRHIYPHFKEQNIKTITSLQCQQLLDSLDAQGMNKTATEIQSILSVIFKAAMDHDILQRNPLSLVYHKKVEHTHGVALSKQEEKLLFDSTAGTEYQLMFAIALYTGMRPNEYETARREGDFIVAKNSKRKNGKVEYKKIPITPMLRPYIKDLQEFTFYTPYTLREKFNEILPNHKLYDLRTTFYSKCAECGVAEVAKKLFVGHSLGQLGNAYTCVSDEYLIKEGEKLNY